MRWPLSAIASAPAFRRLLRASCSSKSFTGPWMRISSPGPCTASAPLTSRRVVSSLDRAWESAPPEVSAWRSCVCCSLRAALCWISWLLARLRSLIRSATLVSSWAASVRATAACERSCTTIRNPSPIAIRLTTINRWLRAVSSPERLSILRKESGIVNGDTQARAAQPAEPQTVNPVAALQLGELVRVADTVGQRRRVTERNHGVGSAEAARIVDQDVDAGVVEGRVGHDPLTVDGDRFRATRPEDIDDVLQVLVMDRPPKRMIDGAVRIGTVMQQDGQARAVQRGQAGIRLLLVELSFDALGRTRSAGGFVFRGLPVR